MRLIIAGSREINNPSLIELFMLDFRKAQGPFELFCGMARGVDMTAYRIAERWDIPIHEYPAKWDDFGKAAGYLRNTEMAENADALLLVWDGYSKGSKHMLNIAIKKRVPMIVIQIVGTA